MEGAADRVRQEVELRLLDRQRRSDSDAFSVAHGYDSGGAFPFDLPHLRLETEPLSAEAAAQRIAEHFDLPRLKDISSKL